MNKINKTIKLNNGVEMPRLGLGVWHIDNFKVKRIVLTALESGYRHIDTAKVYGNEAGVGEAIIKSGLPRKEIFITTKLSMFDLLKPEKAFAKSLERLGLDYVDLYLIHWPFIGWKNAWKGLEKIYKEGKVRAIGVSNFGIKQLEEIKKFSDVIPAVDQVEISPFLSRKKLIDYGLSRGITMEAYSPLTRGYRLNEPVLTNLAKEYNRSPAQMMIRWGLQHDIVIIPKSETINHLKSNVEVFDFEIENKDMQRLDGLNENYSASPLWSRG